MRLVCREKSSVTGSIYQMLKSRNCHSDLEAQRSSGCILDVRLEDICLNHLDEMGGWFSTSSNEPERVQTGVRGGRIVMLQRCSTAFPSDSRGAWSGNTYQVYGAGKVMYRSEPVPEALKQQLGQGNFENNGIKGRITFRPNNGNIDQFFK